MDANQLAEALARAVEAAKPAAEYCFLANQDRWWTVCMTKGEWSGWMQAIFSIVAIGTAFLVAFIAHYLETQRVRERELVLADHVALRVRHSVGLLLQSTNPTLDLLRNACETPLTAEEVDWFVAHLKSFMIDDEKLVALLPAGKGISHSLNQAYSIFAECSRLLDMTKGADTAGRSLSAFWQQTLTSMASAFAALEHANTGLNDYLHSRGFSTAPFDKRAP